MYCICVEFPSTIITEKKLIDLRQRIDSTMIDNPIYVEGDSDMPVYDSVYSECTQRTTSSASANQEYATLSDPKSSCAAATSDLDTSTVSNSARYITDPMHHNTTKLIQTTSASVCLDEDSYVISTSSHLCGMVERTGLTLPHDSATTSLTLASIGGVLDSQDGGQSQTNLDLCILDGGDSSPG